MNRVEFPGTFFLLLCTIYISGAYQPYKDTDPDFAASVHHLKLVVLAELEIIPSLYNDQYATTTTSELFQNLQNYMTDFESSNTLPLNVSMGQFMALKTRGYIDSDMFADDIVKHPLKAYRTLWRFVRFMKTLGLKSKTTLSKFPKTSDLEAAMQNVLRLKQIFGLSVMDVFTGNLRGLQTKSGVSVHQLLELGNHAFSLKMFTHAVDMLDFVLQKCVDTNDKMCNNIDVIQAGIALEVAIKDHDDMLEHGNYDGSDLTSVPPDSSPFVFTDFLKSRMHPDFESRMQLRLDFDFLEGIAKSGNYSKLEMDSAASPFLYEKLCKGESILQAESKKDLRCAYFDHTHPFYLLGPLKAEIHNKDPLIVQIYEVISDKEIRELQSEVKEELRQSRTAVEGEDLEGGRKSRFRTSANAWIEDGLIPKFDYLNERVSLITGLNTTGYYSTEIVQIAAYNTGGHYTPHSDAIFEDKIREWLPESELLRGDRLMTFMLYLSEVEEGGGTGFPTLRTLVNPVKGSAVIWYNLNSDGTINYSMLHGGCPVLYGTKWIANKWIRSNDQMLTRPCPRSRESWKI